MTPAFLAVKNTWTTFLVALLCILVSTSFTKAPRHLRPFYGTYEVTTTIVDPTPPDQEVIYNGAGTATHLGKSTLYAHSFIHRPTNQFYGTATLAAANGDEVHMNFTGSTTYFDNGTVFIERHYTITGGTGRFTAASGALDGNSWGTAGYPPGSVSSFNRITFEGSITY